MAGMTSAGLAVLVCVSAIILVSGSFLWIQGASTAVQPQAFVETDYFHDPTSPSTVLDASRSIAFTFALVTDQPWVSDGFKPYSATLVAVPGSNVSRILMGTIAVFLCNPQCSNTRFLYNDIEPLDETSPDQWATYAGTPHFLYSMGWGSPVYIMYDLAMTVFYADGNYPLGWASPAHLGPIVAVPDNTATGLAVMTWGVLLLAVTATVAIVREIQLRREGR